MSQQETNTTSPSEAGAKPEGFPKLANGSVDWEHVFERPETGFVALVEQTQTVQSLEKIMHLIIAQLFNSNGDDTRRDAFSSVVTEIMSFAGRDGDGPGKPLMAVQSHVVQVLRRIKEDLQERVRKYFADKSEDSGDEADASNRRTSNRRTSEVDMVSDNDSDRRTSDVDIVSGEEDSWELSSDSSSDQAPAVAMNEHVFEAGSAEAFFVDVLAKTMRERFDVLKVDDLGPKLLPDKLPFILSSDFADLFDIVLRDHVLPEMVDICTRVLNILNQKSKDEWPDHMAKFLDDRKERIMMWERWQAAWGRITTARPLPEKPKQNSKSKSSGLKNVMAKLSGDSNGEYQKIVDDWEDAVATVEDENSLAEEVWKTLTAPSDVYVAPTDDDNKFLMEMFGRTASGIETRSRALLQIATQDGNLQ